MFIRRLIGSSPTVIDDAARVLAAAFLDDPTAISMTDNRSEANYLRFRAAATTALLDFEAWGASLTDDGGYGAVMLVKPPGIMYGQTPNAVGPHFEAFKQSLLPKGAAYYNDVQKVLHDVEVKAWGHETSKSTYYISFIGTAPWAQKKGLARGLVRALIDRAREEGQRVTLVTQTEANVKFYHSLGFHIDAELDGDVQGTMSRRWAMSA